MCHNNHVSSQVMEVTTGVAIMVVKELGEDTEEDTVEDTVEDTAAVTAAAEVVAAVVAVVVVTGVATTVVTTVVATTEDMSSRVTVAATADVATTEVDRTPTPLPLLQRPPRLMQILISEY